MKPREEYIAVALLIFALGLLASTMLSREYVVPMGIVIAIIPIWILVRSGFSYMVYLVANHRYMRRTG